jgi:hypothetical protein
VRPLPALKRGLQQLRLELGPVEEA